MTIRGTKRLTFRVRAAKRSGRAEKNTLKGIVSRWNRLPSKQERVEPASNRNTPAPDV